MYTEKYNEYLEKGIDISKIIEAVKDQDSRYRDYFLEEVYPELDCVDDWMKFLEKFIELRNEGTVDNEGTLCVRYDFDGMFLQEGYEILKGTEFVDYNGWNGNVYWKISEIDWGTDEEYEDEEED